MRVVVGLDLAAATGRNTGFCVLDSRLHARTKILHSDEEIIAETVKTRPKLVCVDAPLGIPKGRCCLSDDCKCRGQGHLRECDREMLRMGIKFFPVTLGPMRKLTIRGMTLRSDLQTRGFEVIESYPGAIQDILGFPRKSKDVNGLWKALLNYGVKGRVQKVQPTHDELDAITAALVGILRLKGDTINIGDPAEGLMVLPRVS